MLDYWKRTIGLSLLLPPLAYQADRRYRALPALPMDEPTAVLPSLSIIIPARNEAHNLPHLLPSLQAVCYPGELEIIVVDDNSEDGTAAIAKQYGAKVIQLHSLPPGWLGKPNALCHGAAVANGEWLLFTDADTIHLPFGPAQAVAYAERQKLDGLSLFLAQQFRGLLDSLALTAAFAGMFAAWHPDSPHLNGQFILLRRQAYFESGGFAVARAEPLEDVALGRHLRRSGYRMAMMRGERAAQVRMYQNPRQMWHGLNRLSSQSLRYSGPRVMWTITFITLAMNPLLVLLAALMGVVNFLWLPVTWGAVVLGFLPWSQRHGPLWYAALSPVGAFIVQLAGVSGLLRRLLGRGIYWKGRSV